MTGPSGTDLRGRTALVTGGVGAIGRAIARRFAENGARVVVADLDGATAGAFAAELSASSGMDCIGIALDVSDPAAVQRAASEVTAGFGVCDAVAVNAGVLALAPALELGLGAWRSVIDVNLSGAFYTATAFARPMIDAGRRGTIVFTSSLFGLRGGRGNAAYSASKFGMIGLAQSLAAEWGPLGVRVNTVCPGQIHTAMLDDLFARRAAESGRTADEEAGLFVERIPEGRLGTAEDVAKALVYLSSDASEYVTGHSLLIDGGWQVG